MSGNQLPTSVPLPVLPAVEGAKRLAAYAAVDRHVGLEHKVIGIGSGSTVPYVVERILAQGPRANMGRVFIPTGVSDHGRTPLMMNPFRIPVERAHYQSWVDTRRRRPVRGLGCDH